MNEFFKTFNSHTQAAKAGCPLCGVTLDTTQADYTTNGTPRWRVSCDNAPCKGVLEYHVVYASALRAEPKTREIPDEVPEPTVPPVAVCASWEYVGNMYSWMSAEGEVVSLRRLDPKDFIESVYALFEHNYSRMSSKLLWIKSLKRETPYYVYPQEHMEVGVGEAKSKLEEFYEVGVERGIIKPA